MDLYYRSACPVFIINANDVKIGQVVSINGYPWGRVSGLYFNDASFLKIHIRELTTHKMIIYADGEIVKTPGYSSWKKPYKVVVMSSFKPYRHSISMYDEIYYDKNSIYTMIHWEWQNRIHPKNNLEIIKKIEPIEASLDSSSQKRAENEI